VQQNSEHILKISVVVCTYNRCGSLVKTLQSLAASVLPDTTEWEVLVVDNNSNDRTREAIEGFCRNYAPHFRYLFEGQQGKSHALNTAVRQARGDILAFTDDDVVVEPAWLERLTAALERGPWVGRVLPEATFSPPQWLALKGFYSMGGVLALFDRGDNPGQLDWAPFGANMAFRKEVFEKYGEFRTDLGPPPSELRGEDTEFGYRLMDAGERLRYEPSAVAYHTVPASRIRKEYFLDWWFGFGRCSARKWGCGQDFLGLSRRYLTCLKIMAMTLVMIVPRWLLAVRPEQRFFYRALINRKAGEIYESYRLAVQDR
jgi:glucosyl-dolichyl phosphate glucuronosyltransferase